MKLSYHYAIVLSASLRRAAASASPRVVDGCRGVTYHGLERNGIEVFLGIRYAEDTSGANRFKPPKRHVPAAGSSVNATS